VQKYKNSRLYHHKSKNNTSISKQIIERNNYEFIIIEDILDIDKKELRIKEQEYIDKYDCINKRKSYWTEEQKIEYFKEYEKTDKRKEQKTKYLKQYYQNNKEYIKEYIKEYHQNNKEYKKKYNKDYYFFNKYNDIIAEYINEINKY